MAVTAARGRRYTRRQDDFLLARLGRMPYAEVGARFRRRFGWTPSKSKMTGMAVRHGLRRTVNASKFARGHVPWNKGMKGLDIRGSEKTRFRKGRVPHNEVPMYSERLCPKSGVLIKVPEKNPYRDSGYVGHFTAKGRWVWRQTHGDIPPGFCIVHIDGDRLNNDPSNLECVPRAVLARLNHWHAQGRSADPDANAVRLRIAQLKAAADERSGG